MDLLLLLMNPVATVDFQIHPEINSEKIDIFVNYKKKKFT